MDIAILGAGAWGTALAVNVAGRTDTPHRVSLWARDTAQVAAMRQQRSNTRYLPGILFPPSLDIHTWPHGVDGVTPLALGRAQGLVNADLLILATPMAALRGVLAQLTGSTGAAVAWLCKGFEPAAGAALSAPGQPQVGLMAHEVQAQVAPELSAGVLSGPSFAQEVALGKPAALVAASSHPAVRDALVAALHGPSLRIYSSEDVVGVEVGGAVKNVLAIATGLCDGLELGLNARAALITRGLHEMTRLGVALGAHPETFMGLSGLGDLVLTATGDLSRNRKVGLALAQGRTLEQTLLALGHVAEGVYCARTVVQRAGQLGVDMPIACAVDALLGGRLTPEQALAALMAREARDED